MILCQVCGTGQPEGAIFCDECGAKLIEPHGLATQSISHEEIRPDNAPVGETDVRVVEKAKTSLVKLVILKTGTEIPLAGQDDFTLGRISEGQSIIPDIDLSPFNAYQEGVSRIHASIKVTRDQISLVDLTSINGTAINDAKIPPNVYHPLHEGDIITLGRLKLQVVFDT